MLAGSDGSGPSALPRGTPETLAIALARIAELIDRQEDAIILYTTSHGAPVGLYYNDGDSGYGLISPNRLAAMLDQLGIRNRLLILNACFAGVFVPRLRSDTQRDRHRRLVRPLLVRLRRRERLDLLRRRADQPCAARPAVARLRFRPGERADHELGGAISGHAVAAADQHRHRRRALARRARAAHPGGRDPAGRAAGGRNQPGLDDAALTDQARPLKPSCVNVPLSTSYSMPKKAGPPSQTMTGSRRQRPASP